MTPRPRTRVSVQTPFEGVTEAFSLARITEARFKESVKNRFRPSKYEDPHGALSKLLQLACITEARFEVIAEKEQNIKEKEDITLTLPSEEVSPVVKGPSNASEDTLLSLRKKHLSKEDFQEPESFSAFRVLLQQFQTFLYSRFSFDNDEGLMIRKYFIAYTKTDVSLFHDKLIQHMESLRGSIQERAKHKREYDRRMNDKMMQLKERNVDSSKALDVGLVVTKSNETKSERHVSSSKYGNDTHAEDEIINSVNDKQPMAEVQLSAEDNILANVQQHSEKSESIYDTFLLEKVDRNTNSTNMSHRGREIDQNAKN
nr:hypothetical protein [Tanacetum cinerariifolium]